MLRLRVQTVGGTFDRDVDGPTIEIGRGDERAGIPRLILADPTVSRDHAKLTLIDGGRLRVTNLSQTREIWLPGPVAVAVGQSAEVPLPLTLAVGNSRVTVRSTAPQPAAGEGPSLSYSTLDIRPADMVDPALLRRLRGDPEDQTRLLDWFESLLAVQTAPPGSEAAFDQAARAVVERIGLDRGLILLDRGSHWEIAGRASAATDRVQGREFSRTIVDKVKADRKTVYQSASSSPDMMTESLTSVEALVAAPILGAAGGGVIGVVYGCRAARGAGGRVAMGGIGQTEAHAVQLLAATIAAGLDRAEQAAMSAKLQLAKDAAEAADHAKGQFLALVSHELRTPLTAILGFAEELIDQAEEGGWAALEADLRQMKSSGQRLLTMINELLDLSRIEAGMYQLDPAPFDAAAVLTDVCNSARPLVAKNRNEYAVSIAPGVGTVHQDAARVRQCVINLIGNAAKFTSDGRVSVTAAVANGKLRVVIADTGIGMTAEQMDGLFRPFVQADASISRRFGGSGIGLALSRNLARLMGGDVTVSSTVGVGSEFVFEVPAEAKKPAAPSITVTQQTPAFRPPA